MADSDVTLLEIEKRIAMARENLRELTEYAAASSGVASEEHIADRIAEQEEELKALEDQRDELLKGERT